MIINANSNRVLHIGRVGENNATKVVFDISKWIEEYGNGEVSLVIEQNGVISLIGTTDPALQFEGNKVTWLVSDAFTKMENRGRCELYYSIDNVKVKSVLFDIVVTKSLDGYEEVAPTPYDGWINQLLDASGKVSGAVEAAKRAEDAQLKAEGAKSAAETAQLKAVEAQGLAEGARDEAKQYIGNPPIPDENTKTWWVYDPEDLTANEEGYVNTNMPYNFHIDHIVQNQTELAAITSMKTGDMAAIQTAISNPMNAQLYIYTGNGSINGWEFLLDLSGATGNGIDYISKTSSDPNGDGQGRRVDTYTITYTLSKPTTFTVINGKDGADGTGSGDMLKNDYDLDGVVKTAGGIVKYVESKLKEGGTGVVWKKWTSTNII